MTAWAVILAGGVGSRFWPLSTPQRPKQLLPLVTDRPLLADTVDRLAPLVPPDRTLILTNAALADATAALLPAIPRANIIAEPRPAGTAPALAWAALEIRRRAGPDAVMISVHADWSVGDAEGFRTVLARAADVAAAHGTLVTVGVVPSRPDPGFGYIQPGEPLAADPSLRSGQATSGARRVARFVEKPDVATAERMISEGYLWNSGIFVWRVGDFLDDVRALTPEVAPALDQSDSAERFFAATRSISVDHGVLERSSRVAVLPGDFRWDDIGTWAALRRVRAADNDGNTISGDAHVVRAAGNVVHAEGGTVILYGVSDLVVVTRGGLTLVTSVERAADLKSLLDALPPEVRDRG